MQIVPGKPFRREVKHKRGSRIPYSDFGNISNAISRKRCKIGATLVLITNRKSIELSIGAKLDDVR